MIMKNAVVSSDILYNVKITLGKGKVNSTLRPNQWQNPAAKENYCDRF